MVAHKQKTALVMLVVAWLEHEILCAFGSRPAFILRKRKKTKELKEGISKLNRQLSVLQIICFSSEAAENVYLLETADTLSAGEIHCFA